MRKALCIAALGAMFIAGNALADDKPAGGGDGATAAASAKKHHKAKYGAAGCGLGSMIISSGGIVQIFAATTNGTSANQTFGITSGTSNCGDTDDGDDSARVFVQANRVALAKDISRGSGETIDSLAAIEGCTDSKAVGASLQRNFKTIFPDATISTDKVANSILSTLKSDKTLTCSAISG